MKVLITENKLNNLIEDFLMKSYPDIIRVGFDDVKRQVTGTPIDSEIVNVLEIIIVFGENSIPYTNIDRMNLKNEITRTIKSMFGIEHIKIIFYHLTKSIF